MTTDEARAILVAYRDARGRIAEAVTVLAAAGDTRSAIARESGLSREGVRKILARG